MTARRFAALCAVLAMAWAVPSGGTAHSIVGAASQKSDRGVPRPVQLRLSRDRGLLVTTWINGHGPYVFAVDTGAGLNLVTERVVDETRLAERRVPPILLGGLTSAATTSNREAVIADLAMGDRGNSFRSRTAVIVSYLAQGVDGILDPTDVYSPYGYSIDMPNSRIEALTQSADALTAGLRGAGPAPEAVVVPWLRLSGSKRPFVRLGDGRLALIDTGSGFGLGVNERNAVVIGSRRTNRQPGESHDIGGGVFSSRRVAPTTISIGDLVLRGIPTDILSGVEDNAPLILGRDALYPFRITFDPQKRLIGFITSTKS